MADVFAAGDIPARGAVDVSTYPEDTREVIACVCELWLLKPPTNKKDKAYWIESSRRVAEACGKWPPRRVLRLVFADWNTKLHKGEAYTVEGPGSLVKVARAQAALMRAQGAVMEAPSADRAWEMARGRILGMDISIDPMVERAAKAVGGWSYLSEIALETARLVFAGKYREVTSKALVGTSARPREVD